MRALDEAKNQLRPPTESHEAYQVNPWSIVGGSILSQHPYRKLLPPTCPFCGKNVLSGQEVAYRIRGTAYKDRRFVYVHPMCLKPPKTFFEEEEEDE